MKEIIDFIKGHSRFAVVTHLHPDGDALGSAYALAQALNNLGSTAEVILLSPPPKKLQFREFKSLYKLLNEANLAAYDAVISVDCATLARLSGAQEFFRSKPNCNIDHHITNTLFGQINYVEEAAATGEIIYSLIEQMDLPVDRTTAMAVYMAIATDSGNFTYSNTTGRTLRIFSDLVEKGLPLTDMSEKIFNCRSFGATRLIARYIENLRLYEDGKFSISVITLADIKQAGALVEDCEVLINYGREIEGVEISAFVREMSKDTYKVSFRSNEYANVGEIAAEYGGGGHIKAAGCMLKGNIYDILEKIGKSVRDHLK